MARGARGWRRITAGFGALALAAALPAVVHAAPPEDVKPEAAETRRAPLRDQAQVLGPQEAGDFLAGQGRSLGDPVLLLDAGEARIALADATREPEPAEIAIEDARLALDLLHFLGDPRATSGWQPVETDDLPQTIDRAEALIASAEALIAEIEAERAAAAAAPPPEAPPPERKALAPGTGMMIGGAGVLTLGLAGIGVGALGLVRGRDAQREVEDPTVVGSDLDAADQRGKNANIMAYVGFAVGAVGVGVGATLLGLGAKKRKAVGAADDRGDRREAASIHVLPTGQGLVLTGRF